MMSQLCRRCLQLGSAELALGILPIINIDCVFDVRLAHAA